MKLVRLTAAAAKLRAALEEVVFAPPLSIALAATLVTLPPSKGASVCAFKIDFALSRPPFLCVSIFSIDVTFQWRSCGCRNA
jgi:hypothetical protein